MDGAEFKYQVISDRFSEGEIDKYRQWISQGIGKVCNRNMTIELNSEWVARHYLAVKMILSATVMITSLEYAIEKNLMISVPYLSYYAILNCCRAIVFTLPTRKWEENLIEMNHSTILKTVGDCIRKFNINRGNEISSLLFQYKDYRELFSYKFPSSGIDLVRDFGNEFEYADTVQLCKMLCEIAQLNSERVEKYVKKHCFSNIDEWGKLTYKYMKQCFVYKHITKKDLHMIDEEDECAIRYIIEHHPFPINLSGTLPGWKIKNLFATWEHDEIKSDQYQDIYHPSDNLNVIFQFFY